MDKNIQFVIQEKVKRTIRALEKNNMKGYFVEDSKALIKLLDELIEAGSTVGVGGSMTLFETKVIDYLRERDINFLDRYEEGLTNDDMKQIYGKCFTADYFLTSSNAITEDGELYNVDGNGNRVAAMIYGPEKVIVIAGINKIVKSIDEAVERNREIAAPANSKRLNRQTPCIKTGKCMDCDSPERICCAYTIIRKQLKKDRIHVLFVNDTLGY